MSAFTPAELDYLVSGRRTGRAAIVVDDVLAPWRPRSVEVRGRAEAISGPSPLIRIHPDGIVSWGLEGEAYGHRRSRAAG